MKFQAIHQKKSIVEMVVDQIMSEVSTGKLKAGDTLPVISELAKEFKVGISTLREALRILETRGIIKILPRKGIRVLSSHDKISTGDGFEVKLRFDRSYISDLLDAIFMHISAGAVPACRRRTPPQNIKEIKRIVSDLQRSVETIDKEKDKSETYDSYSTESSMLSYIQPWQRPPRTKSTHEY